jgi:hypothetical protein
MDDSPNGRARVPDEEGCHAGDGVDGIGRQRLRCFLQARQVGLNDLLVPFQRKDELGEQATAGGVSDGDIQDEEPTCLNRM